MESNWDACRRGCTGMIESFAGMELRYALALEVVSFKVLARNTSPERKLEVEPEFNCLQRCGGSSLFCS